MTIEDEVGRFGHDEVSRMHDTFGIRVERFSQQTPEAMQEPDAIPFAQFTLVNGYRNIFMYEDGLTYSENTVKGIPLVIDNGPRHPSESDHVEVSRLGYPVFDDDFSKEPIGFTFHTVAKQ